MILLIDTFSSTLSLGLAATDGTMLREFQAEPDWGADERAIHDARLAMECANLLKSESISPKEITRIGIIIGPGSFTGLRISLSFAKGFAFAVGASIVPIALHEGLQDANRDHEGYIITPGYRADLFYVAHSHTPRDIRLLSGAEVLNLAGPILAHDYFLRHPSSFMHTPFISVALSLAAMARMTAGSSERILGAALDALEPLYLTEFNAQLPRSR